MEIKDIFHIYKTSVFQKDLEAYASIFDEDVRVFDMWQQWTYDGLDAWRAVAKEWFTSLGTDKDVVSYSDIQAFENGETAVITALMRFTAVSEKGEELRFLENRLTWVALKKDDVWKIIHQHTSSPIDFESMKVILKR